MNTQSMLFEVKYMGPTNYRGARVKITNYDFVDGKGLSRILNLDYESTSVLSQAIRFLTRYGFKVIATNDRYKKMEMILVEWNWDLLTAFLNREFSKVKAA